MNGDDPIDALFDDLRQPATATELAGESKTVDAVVISVISMKGSPMRLLSNSRRLRVASFVAAGIIGFGGVAAAGPAVYGTVVGGEDSKPAEPAGKSVSAQPERVVELAPVPEVSTTQATTTSSVPEDDGPALAVIEVEVDEAATSAQLVDDLDTKSDEFVCADGNHGKTVSSVAHATPSGPAKGKIVSEAAHSPCAKDDMDDDDADHDDDSDTETDHDDDDDSDHDDDDDSDHDDDEKPEKPEKSGGHGNSAGGSRGNSSNDKGGKHRDD
jgi:hypothetical protein